MAASKGSSNFSTATSSLDFDLGSKPPRTSNSFSGGTDSLFSDHKTQDSDGFGDIFGDSARFADKSDGGTNSGTTGTKLSGVMSPKLRYKIQG
ncbi:hypothetical protein PIB30_000403 [Stylosanthes scabra]|uniref:Uncharacterized protein n=1 Tax=Stylosanthes scabra TaxID=79078 RepID=A0ABU6U2N2_9FABA|nr:hypothetical protein [Stylosanthes scabra]